MVRMETLWQTKMISRTKKIDIIQRKEILKYGFGEGWKNKLDREKMIKRCYQWWEKRNN